MEVYQRKLGYRSARDSEVMKAILLYSTTSILHIEIMLYRTQTMMPAWRFRCPRRGYVQQIVVTCPG